MLSLKLNARSSSCKFALLYIQLLLNFIKLIVNFNLITVTKATSKYVKDERCFRYLLIR